MMRINAGIILCQHFPSLKSICRKEIMAIHNIKAVFHNIHIKYNRNLKDCINYSRRYRKVSFERLRCLTTKTNKDILNNTEESSKENILKDVLEKNKQKLLNTEQTLRTKSEFIIKDIKETKHKMKEKMEEVIERENIYTIPNLLCIARILASPYLGYLIVEHDFHLAFGLLVVAGVTDLMDGWIARNWTSQSTKLGSFLDPMADKVLIATLFLTLTYSDLIPVVLTGIIIARDVLLVAAGFTIRYISLPKPRTLSRYFDASHATAQLAPTFISKVNTTIQLTLVATTLAAPVFNFIDHTALHYLWYVTGITTLASALSYIVRKDTYKLLQKKKKL